MRIPAAVNPWNKAQGVVDVGIDRQAGRMWLGISQNMSHLTVYLTPKMAEQVEAALRNERQRLARKDGSTP